MRLLLLLLAVTQLPLIALADEKSAEEKVRLFFQGRFAYERNCAVCHGPQGRGDGDWAVELIPKPRDFRTGVFKFRSTPCGFLPTDEDLVRTIRNGISGTAMPAFKNISDDDLAAILVFLKNLSRRWDDPKLKAEPLTIPEVPKWFFDEEEIPAHIDKGKKLFLMNCAVCHGEKGDGKGPGAAALKDIWGNVITPGNLTLPQHKSGNTQKDLFRTISLGLDGTPMVGYGNALTPGQIWNLIAFIQSIESDAQ